MEHLPGIEDISDGYYWIRRSGFEKWEIAQVHSGRWFTFSGAISLQSITALHPAQITIDD